MEMISCSLCMTFSQIDLFKLLLCVACILCFYAVFIVCCVFILIQIYFVFVQRTLLFKF